MTERALKGVPLARASEVPMCEIGLACTTWTGQRKMTRSSGNPSVVVSFVRESLVVDGVSDHHRQCARIAKALPLRLASQLHLAKGDPKPALSSSLKVAALGVPTKSKELLVHDLSSSWLEAEVSRDAAEMLLEAVLQQPMSLVPGRLEQHSMLRHGVHVDEPLGVGGEAKELLLEGEPVAQGILLELVPCEEATNWPEPCKGLKPRRAVLA